MQWTRERSTELDGVQNSQDFKTPEDFLRLWTQIDRYAPQMVALLAENLTTPNEPPSIESLLKLAQEPAEFSDEPEMLLTAACAFALRRSPQPETWLRVKKIWYTSWQIEHWLNAAMTALVQRDAGSRDAYIELAKLLFNKLDSGCLMTDSRRTIEARENSLAYWQSADYPLDELWDGLRHADFMSYEHEMWIFGLLNEIAPADFQQLIAGSSNPVLVNAALLGAGVGAFNPRFAQWESCVRAAPLAFSECGSWTGSLVLPLLLAHSRNELLEPGRRVPRYGANEDEITELTNQISELVCAVVDALALRIDALATFRRWSTWLMLQMLGSKESDFSDIRSDTFVDNALLEAIGKAMEGQQLPLTSPKEAAPWEAWCYLCVRSSFAHDGFISTPSFDDFASEWQLTPESWHGPQGRRLLERANRHLPRDNLPGLSANFLVAPLASSSGFASDWKQLWDSAYHLREVLEFGSLDAGDKSYSDRVDASHLLLLLGCMGLACFDQAAGRLAEATECIAEEMISLHEVLSSAVLEVLYVDETLHRGKWQTLLQHLALRRVYWDSNYTADNRVAVFVEQFPAVRDYLGYFQADPSDLVAFLHACILNQLDTSELRKEIQGASVDLRACVETLEKLHALREHRYPIRYEAIKAIQPLMD